MPSKPPKPLPIRDTPVANPHRDALATRTSRSIDPLVHSSFREALLVSGIWLAAMIWSLSVCYSMGYKQTAADLRLVLGFPDWIFWGIVIPWITCTIVSCVFGAIYVRDGDLGADPEENDEPGLGG